MNSDSPASSGTGTGRASMLVAAGIFVSRIGGLLRTTLTSTFLGQSAAADVFTQAIKIPNFLQNLFGEGVLSASFIPVYAGLMGAKNRDEADRVARAVLSLLALVVSIIVIAGVLFTPWIIALISPGFEGEKRELTVRVVRILFPGVGFLVISAWCLGVLNSHGKFFLSYAAPALWNLAMIASLIVFRHGDNATVVLALGWGGVIGSALQLGLQFPTAWRFVSSARSRATIASPHVRKVLDNFAPVLLGRGVVQLSAYVDSYIVSWLPDGCTTALGNATQLYSLPIGLFGMSIAAAQLPAMSSAVGARVDVEATLRSRIAAGQRTMAAFTVPSAVAFLAIGDVITSLIFEHGKYTHDNAIFVWAVLAGSTIGLLSTTLGRMYSAGFYALGDTRTPLKFAAIRVVVVAALGYLFAFPLPHALGIDVRWGTAGLTASAGIAGWIEFLLLRRGLSRRIGAISLPMGDLARIWMAALIAAVAATGARWLAPAHQPFIEGPIVIGAYGIVYLAIAHAWGLLTIDHILTRLRRTPRVIKHPPEG